MRKGKDPIYNGAQGKNLSIFAKMPFISTQKKRIVKWDEVNAKAEQNGSCNVEEIVEFDVKKYREHLRSLRRDLKRGLEGLEHKKFKY
jgi:hypothetical protein